MALVAQSRLAQKFARRLGLEYLPQAQKVDHAPGHATIAAIPELALTHLLLSLGAHLIALQAHQPHPLLERVVLQQRRGRTQHSRKGGERKEQRHQRLGPHQIRNDLQHVEAPPLKRRS